MSANRQPAFDAALTAYLPQLKRQAAYINREHADDLLNDAIVSMLHLADRCRLETFKTWAQIILRRTAGNRKREQRAEKRTAVMVAMPQICTPAAQEAATDLRLVTDALSTVKHGDILLRRANGDLLRDIGKDRGTNKEAVRQLEVKARAALMVRLGEAA